MLFFTLLLWPLFLLLSLILPFHSNFCLLFLLSLFHFAILSLILLLFNRVKSIINIKKNCRTGQIFSKINTVTCIDGLMDYFFTPFNWRITNGEAKKWWKVDKNNQPYQFNNNNNEKCIKFKRLFFFVIHITYSNPYLIAVHFWPFAITSKFVLTLNDKANTVCFCIAYAQMCEWVCV